MSLVRRWLQRGRDAMRHAIGQRDGLRVFHQRPEHSSGVDQGDIRHGTVAAVLATTLERTGEFEQSMEGLPAATEVFYHADGHMVSSWGLLVPNVTRWPVTEVDGLMVAAKPFSVLISFHTLESYRGRGLYPALLQAMSQFVSSSGIAPDLLIWCHRSNHASVRGIQKAGFVEVGVVQRSLTGRSLLLREPDPRIIQALGLQFTPRAGL